MSRLREDAASNSDQNQGQRLKSGTAKSFQGPDKLCVKIKDVAVTISHNVLGTAVTGVRVHRALH